jgi:hypothetical protein
MLFLDPLAILIATISFVLLAFLWFSPLFMGHLFSKETRTHLFIYVPAVIVLGGWVSLFLSLLQSLLRVSAVIDGLYLALFLFIGFIVPWVLLVALLKRNSWRWLSSWALFVLVVLLVMNGVLAA